MAARKIEPRRWDWWMASLPDLVWPAEGLGRWEPKAPRALDREALRLCLLREKKPAARRRLRRILGESPAQAARGRSRSRSPKEADARAWLAEELIEDDPARALRLLKGSSGARPSLYRGAALMGLKRWKEAAAALGEAPSAISSLLAAAALLRAGAPAAALAALRRSESFGGDASALHWLRAYALQKLGRVRESRLSVEQAMLRF